MLVKYDCIYQEEDYFGTPYPELVQFFEEYEQRGTVLDLGCGQGRDALALVKLGFNVTGVDISTLGIEQMLRRAHQEDLTLTGLVADMYEFSINEEFDFILLDSILHFYKRDRVK